MQKNGFFFKWPNPNQKRSCHVWKDLCHKGSQLISCDTHLLNQPLTSCVYLGHVYFQGILSSTKIMHTEVSSYNGNTPAYEFNRIVEYLTWVKTAVSQKCITFREIASHQVPVYCGVYVLKIAVICVEKRSECLDYLLAEMLSLSSYTHCS